MSDTTKDVGSILRDLRRSEERYRLLLDTLPHGIEEVDIEGRILVSNAAHHRMHGYEVGSLIGRSVFDLVAEGPERDALREQFAHLVREQPAPEPYTGVGLTRDGRHIDVRVAWNYRRDDAGDVVGFVGIVTDITEQRRAEQALRESEERFREMAENVREAFWLFDWREGRVLYVSPAYETIWGRKAADLLERYEEWGESIHPDDVATASESFERIAKTGGGELREYRIIRPDGEVRWISDRGFAIRDEDGEVVRIAGVAEDVTDRKRAEEEHLRLEAKIQQAQKLESLGVLAGGIAHDFNNLLMGVLGNADLALARLAPEAPGRSYLVNIESAAQRAAELTHQMLAYSGKGRFVVRPIDLNRLVEEMAHLLRTVISKRATLRFEMTRPLPPVAADASQVRQVVMNLLTNASEALGDGDGAITVRTGTAETGRSDPAASALLGEIEEGECVFLEVSDSGSGMDEATRARIFDPFFTTKFTGRGLGLAAVLGIVRGHGGAIHVRSEPGRGSTFRVLFPPSPEPLPSEEPGPREPDPEPVSASTVLVVDDEEAVRQVSRAMLEVAGYDVLTANDGVEGVEVFRENAERIDVVLLDMTMPRMSGEEAFRAIRKIRPDARVILSSGYNEQEATNRFAGSGLAGFVQKPYRSVDLLARIRDACRLHP